MNKIKRATYFFLSHDNKAICTNFQLRWTHHPSAFIEIIKQTNKIKLKFNASHYRRTPSKASSQHLREQVEVQAHQPRPQIIGRIRCAHDTRVEESTQRAPAASTAEQQNADRNATQEAKRAEHWLTQQDLWTDSIILILFILPERESKAPSLYLLSVSGCKR